MAKSSIIERIKALQAVADKQAKRDELKKRIAADREALKKLNAKKK